MSVGDLTVVSTIVLVSRIAEPVKQMFATVKYTY